MANLSQLKSKQRGATFLGMLFIAAVIGILFIVGAKVAPTVIEYQAILKAVNTAKNGQLSRRSAQRVRQKSSYWIF